LIPAILADCTLHSTLTPIQVDQPLGWSTGCVQHVGRDGDGIELPVAARLGVCRSSEHHIATA
jgi:hypothetical protein